MPSVLFVCTANICRSPMASALFRQMIEARGDAALWRIESAGTWAITGEPPAKKSQQLMEERGLDIQDYRSRSVSKSLLQSFKLILTMENGHKEALRAEFPEIAERVYLLSEMVGGNYEIRDPMGGSMAEFQDTVHEIETILSKGFERICQLAG